MKKRASLIAFALVAALGCGAVAGCSNGGSAAEAEVSDGTVPLMPVDHDGRFDAEEGGEKCYTCHGATKDANPKVESAVAMPEDHYADASYDSLAIDPVRNQCITCHVQDRAE